ncbi:MAG: alpha/beta fold hydrolase [Pirellulales bacterium]|nr:alpha/beta fold hydrolase [Pirellulales bacterium]
MRAQINGTDLYFDVDGAGLAALDDCMVERPVVFLLHGGPGSDHTEYKATSAPLRDVAQLVYVDNRGSGLSSRCDPSTYTLDQNVDDVEALRQYLGLERIIVLGSSYGGMVAQGYALRYPARLSGLILVATAPSHRYLDEGKRIVAQRGTQQQIDACEPIWQGQVDSLEQLHEFYRIMFPLYSLTATAENVETAIGRGRFSVEPLNQGLSGFLREFDLTEQLKQIACSTLVLAGAHDWICAPHFSQLMAEQIPNAQLEMFTNSSHAIASDEPEKYLRCVREFILGAGANSVVVPENAFPSPTRTC